MKPKQKLFEEIKKLLKKNVTGEEKIDLKKLEIWDSLIYLDLVSTIEQYTKKKLTAVQIHKITDSRYLVKTINSFYGK
jgi:acyl carrier protein